MTQIQSLHELREAVQRSIGAGSAFGLLNARLLILLGINLRDISPKQDKDTTVVKRAVEALGRMGIRLEAAKQ